MKLVQQIDTFVKISNQYRKKIESIGFVPTMGALHEGHLKLIEESITNNKLTIVSIFVNPLQFNDKSDFRQYPKTLDSDIGLLEKYPVDYLLLPRTDDLYKSDPDITMQFGKLDNIMEGVFRPNHFSSVAVVVSKLFHIVQPHNAYFGLKDLQQYLIIKKLVENLSFNINIVGVDTVREESGLAISSRNSQLSTKEKEYCSNIYKGLSYCKKLIFKGYDLKEVLEKGQEFYKEKTSIKVEYFEIVDGHTLQRPNNLIRKKDIAICFAGYINGVRLIDNLYFRI